MLNFVFIFTCLACVGHSGRVQTPEQESSQLEKGLKLRKMSDALSHLLAETSQPNEQMSSLGDIFILRKAFVSLLLALNPVVMFNPGFPEVRLPAGASNRLSQCILAAERPMAENVLQRESQESVTEAGSEQSHGRDTHGSHESHSWNQEAGRAPWHDLILPQESVTEDGGSHILHTHLVQDQCPVLCFINSDAGGGQGSVVKEMLKHYMHPYQIVDVMKADTHAAIKAFAKLGRYRILVCGGDGTAAEALSTVQHVHREIDSMSNVPGIALLPIGTGNDLAASLGWGRGFRRREQLPVILEKVQKSQPVPIDRWEISINGASRGVFQNYLGIGIDASIAYQCDALRGKYPALFFNRWLNRKYYGLMGFFDFVRNRHRDFSKQVKIHVDGKELILPRRTKGIVLMNLKSYGGGSQVWFDDELHKFEPASISDGLFEILAISGPVQLGGVKSGISRPKKIGQGAHITIETRTKMPIQADGEPWKQEPCTVSVERSSQSAYMLYPNLPFKGVRRSIKDFFC